MRMPCLTQWSIPSFWPATDRRICEVTYGELFIIRIAPIPPKAGSLTVLQIRRLLGVHERVLLYLSALIAG